MLRMAQFLPWIVIAALAALLVTNAAAAPVETEAGSVEGVAEGGVIAFKGIPFAAPPVGPLRWRAPSPPAPWTDVKIADAFSPVCPQIGMYPDDSPAEPMSEDCLYLNIWAPENAAGEALPVMVWIHGGGLQNGSGSAPVYGGDALARRGVIVVTINYRLGALGFLALEALSAESPNGISGNYGLLDQIAALHWVKRNIAAFGGDAGNVTVFGQSSGAISISALVASPLARGLFRRAIGQSGGLFEPLEVAPEFTPAGAEAVGEAFAGRLGAPTLAALRAKTPEEILAKRFTPQPVIDGYLLSETPYDALKRGRANDVDLLVGANKHEGLYFISGRDIRAANFLEELKRDFPPFIVDLIGPKSAKNDSEAREAFVAFEGDMRFGWNMWTWARLGAEAGRGRVFYYQFGATPAGEEGASHGAELAYVFDNLDSKSNPWSADDRRLADMLATYWTNFARTGDPNGEGLPVWPLFDAQNEQALLIGETIVAGRPTNGARLRTIDRLYAAVRFLIDYWIGIAAVAALLGLAVIWRIAAAIGGALARGRRSSSNR